MIPTDDDESPDGEWLWYTGEVEEGKNDLDSDTAFFAFENSEGKRVQLYPDT